MGARERKAFEDSKQLLVSSQVLVHFDSKLELVLACDASVYGVGVVLSHHMPDGTKKPIVFASRTLSDTERRYSQVEKEALAIVKHFHSYIYGRHFYLQTDHKPLTTLLSESRSVPQMASGRIMRWALTLSSYEYTLVFRSTTQHGNAPAAHTAAPGIIRSLSLSTYESELMKWENLSSLQSEVPPTRLGQESPSDSREVATGSSHQCRQ